MTTTSQHIHHITEATRASLEDNYVEAVEMYTNAFIAKHDFEEYDRDMWVAGEIGGVIAIGDMFINFEDIRYDIYRDIAEPVFTKWYWNSLECHEIGLDYPNYQNYCKGAPTPEPSTIERVKTLRRELMDLTGKPIFF